MNNDSNFDDVTGLAAFDDLDPVSVVSELSSLPEQQGYQAGYQGHYPEPEGANTAQASSIPAPISSTRPVTSFPPGPYDGGMNGAHQSAHEGNGQSMATRHFDLPGPNGAEDQDHTMQFSLDELDQATEVGDDYSDFEDSGYGNELAQEPSVQVAAEISMEWDDDESETRIHHGADHPGVSTIPPATSPSDLMVGAAIVPGGAPSPFPTAPGVPQGHFQAPAPIVGGGAAMPYEPYAGGYPPSPQAPGFAANQPPLPPPPVPSPDTLIDEPIQDNRWSARMALLLTVGFLGVGTALAAAYNMFSGGEATITLATTPADAEVTLDGESLTGQTSPYVLSVVADEEHALVVRKDGYEPYQMPLKAKAGENRALPQIELKKITKEMGFSIDSNPPGAKVLVDGKDTGEVTPARILDMSGGTHKVELVSGDDYPPFEIQVFVPEDNVVALPKAELERQGQGKRSPTVASGPRRRSPQAGAIHHGGGLRGGGQMRGDRQQARQQRQQARQQARQERQARGEQARQQRQARAAQRKPRGGGAGQASPFGTPNRKAAVQGGGTLRLNSRPWAQIAVDGRPVGNTPQLNLKVPAGVHTVKFSNPQLSLTKTIKVKVRKNQTVTKVVNLIE